jgi:D-amino-acid dehydrogenase
LQLFRSERDVKLAEPACQLLVENEIPHRIVDAEAAREIEPALGYRTELTGGLYFPDDESGNCPLFTKHMRHIAQSIGVHFHFTSTVHAIEPEGGSVSLRIGDVRFSADAVVVAAGVDSAQLLKPLGIHVPLFPVKGYSATAPIKNFDEAPRAALLDESYKIAITRMGDRIRVAGIADFASNAQDLHKTALRTLIKVGSDWFPNAANYNTSTFWSGARPMLPDGPPLLGTTPVRNVYINIGHGSSGWAMAMGSGKVLADIVSGRTPDIDMDGLTLSRYG